MKFLIFQAKNKNTVIVPFAEILFLYTEPKGIDSHQLYLNLRTCPIAVEKYEVDSVEIEKITNDFRLFNNL